MLRSGNTLCARPSTWWLCCIIIAALAAPLFAGDPPSETAAREAFAVARQWVNAVAVPSTESPDASVSIDGASGVCVILRRSGRVLGSGADWSGDSLMLRRAVARALGELLGDPAVQNLPEDMKGTIGTLISIELDLAGTPEPIVAQSFEQAGRQLDPGISGIAMRRDRDWAYLFPAQFRANNTADVAHRQFLALTTDLALPSIGLADLKAKHNAAAYSFRTLTLMQSEAAQAPFVATRGENVVPLDAVTAHTLRDWAAQAATNLTSRFAPPRHTANGEALPAEPLGMMGTYNPLADAYDPLFAPPIEQAIAAFALHAASQSTVLDASMQERCRAAAARLLRDLATTTSVEVDPIESAAASALIVITMAPGSFPDQGELHEISKRATQRLMQAFVLARDFEPALNPHDRAIVAYALVQLANHDPLTVPRDVAIAAVDKAWASVNETQRVALLPWIGWAAMELASNAGETLTHAEALRDMATGLCASRVPVNHQPYAGDLAGGLPIMAGGRSHPSSQTLRPASWLATALRDPRICPAHERDNRHAELREIMRFVRQLMVRDETVWRFRHQQRALGGFRAATWDASQPVPAQALGLITLLEAAETLENARNQQPEGLGTRKSP